MSEGDKSEVAVPTTEETDSPKGTKRPAPDSTEDDQAEKVHSANDWEHANMGDTDRKSKFLRLMGAKKTEHHGTFVIGEQARSKERTAEHSSHLVENLEDQFEKSRQHKLESGFKGHIGLGFEKEEAKTDDQTVTSTEKSTEDTKVEGENQEKNTESENTAKSVEKAEPEAAVEEAPDSSTTSPKPSDKYSKMGFVKSSS